MPGFELYGNGIIMSFCVLLLLFNILSVGHIHVVCSCHLCIFIAVDSQFYDYSTWEFSVEHTLCDSVYFFGCVRSLLLHAVFL